MRQVIRNRKQFLLFRSLPFDNFSPSVFYSCQDISSFPAGRFLTPPLSILFSSPVTSLKNISVHISSCKRYSRTHMQRCKRHTSPFLPGVHSVQFPVSGASAETETFNSLQPQEFIKRLIYSRSGNPGFLCYVPRGCFFDLVEILPDCNLFL
jgi:hypothetical protein